MAVPSAAIVVLTTVTSLAWATPVPMSLLPSASNAIPAAHGTVRIAELKRLDDSTSSPPTVLTTAMDSPVCVGSEQDDIGGGVALLNSPNDEKLLVERLIEGPEPVLERLLVEARSSELPAWTILGRARVGLVRIETRSELPVYAYRTADVVHVLVPQGFNDARDAFAEDLRAMYRQQCGFFHITLGLGGSARRSVVLAHAMPKNVRWIVSVDELFGDGQVNRPVGHAPVFSFNASLSKVSRDREPLLSVNVRAIRPKEEE